jgi:hypothetical protein
MSTSIYQLLASCAHLEGDLMDYRYLAQQVSQFTSWSTLTAQAEAHGLGPLL